MVDWCTRIWREQSSLLLLLNFRRGVAFCNCSYTAYTTYLVWRYNFAYNALVNGMFHPIYPRQGPSLLSHWQITSDLHARHFFSIVSHRCDSCVSHFIPIVYQVIGTVYVSLVWLYSESFYTNCQSMKWMWCASIYMNCMTHIGQWRTLPGV